jgi:hypothetical protein
MKMAVASLAVDVAVGDFAALHFQSVQGDDLLDQHIARARAPVRILMRDLAAMRRELEDPERINARHGARKELGGLDDFTGDDPLRLVRLGLGWRLVAFAAGFFRGSPRA